MRLEQRILSTKELITNLEILIPVSEEVDAAVHRASLERAKAELTSLQHAIECRDSTDPVKITQWNQWQAMDEAKRKTY